MSEKKLWLSLFLCIVLLCPLASFSGNAEHPSELANPKILWKNANHTVYGFLPYWTSSSYTPEWAVLTHLAWFGESLSSTGTVSSSHPLSSSLLSQAHANGVKVTLTITCFNSTTIDSVLANYRTAAVNNILAKVQNYGCDGVSIDFEGIRATNSISGESNKVLFEDFMHQLYSRFKSTNPDYHISLCAPAVDWSNIFRNSNLSSCVDAFLIMGYDYFYSGSATTGPVAPLEGYTYNLKSTLSTYLNYWPASKIVILLPFYGFDWPCNDDSPGSATTGSGSAVIMKNAVANAQSYGRRWHAVSATPWYAYQTGGVWHQCWYDDTESLSIKLELVFEYGLQGSGMWALGYETPSVWNLISQKFGGVLSLSGKKIAIDPGHGGSDVGATGIDGAGFPNEEDFTLDIALRVANLLQYAGATVILTRSSDADVSLQERCDIANNANADIFVSIHMNSAGESAWGTETFYYANSDTDYSVEGKLLAQNVQAKIVSRLGTYNRGIKGDYPYFGYHLYVLSHTNMPATLTEVCFISNSSDFNLISLAQKRTLAALSIYEGICSYFGVTPVYSSVALNIKYPSDGSSVTGTLKFIMDYGNRNMLTKCRWRIENGQWNVAFNRDWFFNSPAENPVSFNTYSYSVGWKNLYFEVSDLWGNTISIEHNLFFTRNLAFEGIVWGSSSAHNLTDDNDDNYAANNLGQPLYIALRCNHTIRAIKTHWWDGDNRYYQYKIEVSRDNSTWLEVVNKTNGEYRSWQWDSVNTTARYIRITGTYNSANQWYHIKELQIFGSFKTPYSIYGHVVDSVGNPLSNVSVLALNLGNNQSLTTKTDEYGYYEIELNALNFSNTDEFRIVLSEFGETASFVLDDRETSREISFTVSATPEFGQVTQLFAILALALLCRFRKK